MKGGGIDALGGESLLISTMLYLDRSPTRGGEWIQCNGSTLSAGEDSKIIRLVGIEV